MSTPRTEFLSNNSSRINNLVGEHQNDFGEISIQSEEELIRSQNDLEKSEIFDEFRKLKKIEDDDSVKSPKEDLESERMVRLGAENERLRRRLERSTNRTRNSEKQSTP